MIYLLSEPLLFMVCLLMAASVTMVATLVILLFRRGEARCRPSLLPPPFITAIVFPASIVIGLLVNDTWKRFMDAQDVVQQESAVLDAIVTQKSQLALQFRAAVIDGIDRYTQVQIPKDWALFERGELPLANDELVLLLQQIDAWLTDENRIDPAQRVYLDRLRNGVLELRKLRAKRIVLSVGKMDGPKWWVVFCLLFTCTLAMSEITLHVRSAYLSVAALFIIGNGSVIYMLATHERPFAGGTMVKAPAALMAAKAQRAPTEPMVVPTR